MAQCTMNRFNLMDLIQKTSFAVDDIRLYLDTHPDCEEGLKYHHKVQAMRNEAVKLYTENFGPIYSYFVEPTCDNESWNWNEGPLPWEPNFSTGGGR